jgi:hypothetical protein
MASAEEPVVRKGGRCVGCCGREDKGTNSERKARNNEKGPGKPGPRSGIRLPFSGHRHSYFFFFGAAFFFVAAFLVALFID